ncbi:hypothetical protein Mgra_00008388 [Meloidogyne graminicola]|uniref:Uncharacterized protein n=2 Tax=Meloidogyne graminicola TaxID=189291 RepID=A0A8S9ZFV6_9BILA|nr:hypothetical protein Mgra_00008388 [Meloidogyne graminicola]
MVSISYFLQFVALLLFFVSVHCEYFVGHGNHILVNETITKLNINTMIAETKEDIERYMNLVNSCDVTMDNEGNIILWYKENSNTMKNGCSADFVTKKEGQISLEFGIKGNLAKCISGSENNKVNIQNFTDNTLSFAYSLKNYELNEIKDGPKNGNESDCRDLKKCVNRKGNCLKNTPFYSFGWLKSKYSFPFSFDAVGGVWFYWDKLVREKSAQSISAEILINKTQLNSSTSCYKKHHELKEWEIKDKNYNYNNKNFTSLFTFHIMPINSMRKSIQKMVLNCNNDDKREICSNETTMQKCDKMFIKFDKEHFKLLIPPNVESTTKYIPFNTTNTTLTSKSTPINNIKYSTISTIKTTLTTIIKSTTAKTESSEIWILIATIVIVGFIIICCILFV